MMHIIRSLRELSDTINDVVNFLIAETAEKSTNGSYSFAVSDVFHLISRENFEQFFPMILSELKQRDEFLDFSRESDKICCSIGPYYCKNYQWQEGDEKVFHCTKDEWEKSFQPMQVSQPLSLGRMAEIGKKSIAHVLESSDIAIEDLTESIGMSMKELKQLDIYDPDPAIETGPAAYTYDVFNGKTGEFKTFTNVKDALLLFKDLGNNPLSFVSFVVPENRLYAGYHTLIQQNDNGKLELCFENKPDATIAVKRLHEHFAGTEVERAFAKVQQYYRDSLPIRFYVKDNTNDEPEQFFESFDAALKAYDELPSRDAYFSLHVSDEQGRGLGSHLCYRDVKGGERICSFGKFFLEQYPHGALAHSLMVLSRYPNDMNAWNLRDKAEAALGITDRIVDYSKDLLVGKWRVHIVPTGGRHGTHNQVINEGKPIVEFYDTSVKDDAFARNGQYVASYRIDSFLGTDNRWGGWKPGNNLMLYTDIPQWTVSAAEMDEVVSYLKEFQSSLNKASGLDAKIGDAEVRKTPFVQERSERNAPEL